MLGHLCITSFVALGTRLLFNYLTILPSCPFLLTYYRLSLYLVCRACTANAAYTASYNIYARHTRQRLGQGFSRAAAAHWVLPSYGIPQPCSSRTTLLRCPARGRHPDCGVWGVSRGQTPCIRTCHTCHTHLVTRIQTRTTRLP